MYLKNKKLFLAGATGLAGRGILQHVLEQYPSVRIRASYHTGVVPRLQSDSVEFVRGDLTSLEDCRAMARGCDCAIMGAAFTGGAGFVASATWKHIKDNLLMNTQMLEAFQLENVRRVIYIGSATLYQDFEGSIKENELDLNKDPHHAYLGFGWVVRLIEKLCDVLHTQHQIDVIKVRSSNIFGPFAKFDPATSNFIPAIIRKAIDRMDPFEIWGSPDVTRDVIYIEDFARAIGMMLDRDDIRHETFNVGTDTRTTVGDVVRWSLKAANHMPSEIRYVQDRPTTMRYKALDCSKVRSMLQWQPVCTIEEGIKKTAEWWIENKGWWKK